MSFCNSKGPRRARLHPRAAALPYLGASIGDGGAGHVGGALFTFQVRNAAMGEKKPTYRIEIRNSGTPPNNTFAWNIYRNQDVLPIQRSQQHFVSRMAGLADANRSRRKLVDAKVLG
jgi:hypothetical protein